MTDRETLLLERHTRTFATIDMEDLQVLARRQAATIMTLERELERLAGELFRLRQDFGSGTVPATPVLSDHKAVHWYVSGSAFACGWRPQDDSPPNYAESTTRRDAVTCPRCLRAMVGKQPTIGVATVGHEARLGGLAAHRDCEDL